jgi:hypothetical protein
MSNKLNYQTLINKITNETLKLAFHPELDFITTHRFVFIEQNPDILFALNEGGLSIAMLLAIRSMRENIEAQHAQEKAQAEKDAEWDAKVAESKARQALPDSRQLTGSHRSY